MHARLGLLLLAPLLIVQSTPSHAQDTTRGLSAVMLKRLGEAVDGYRTGRPYWVVMQLEFPHHVYGVFPTKSGADSTRAKAGSGYAVLGPYYATVDAGNDPVLYTIDPCPGKHRWDSECPDESQLAAMSAYQVDSVVIAIHGRDGTIRRRYRATELDAIFFTLSAIDKFAIPYYERLYGIEYAARLRERYLTALRRAR